MDPKDDFRISQFTKELVAGKLRELGDPAAAAAELVKQSLRVALKDMAPGQAADSRVVAEACQGAMTALLLAEQPLPRAGLLLLTCVADLAHELNLDQMEMMRSALIGLADMRRFVPQDVLYLMGSEIEKRFTGAGEAFESLCRQSGELIPR